MVVQIISPMTRVYTVFKSWHKLVKKVHDVMCLLNHYGNDCHTQIKESRGGGVQAQLTGKL